MQVIWKTDGLTIWITDASYMHHTTYTTTVLRPFYQDHPGEPVPEENFWTLCKGLTYVNDARSISNMNKPIKDSRLCPGPQCHILMNSTKHCITLKYTVITLVYVPNSRISAHRFHGMKT